MSASLVGSEMCIRDRCSTRAARHQRRGPSPRLRPGPLRRALRRRVPRSVSYTHLTLPTICSV
eukprot:3705835-Alexandrium_andersonii.AAC.1